MSALTENVSVSYVLQAGAKKKYEFRCDSILFSDIRALSYDLSTLKLEVKSEISYTEAEGSRVFFLKRMYQAARRHIPEHRRLKRRFLFLGTDQRKVCSADMLYKAVNASRMTWYAVIILCDISVATFMSARLLYLRSSFVRQPSRLPE